MELNGKREQKPNPNSDRHKAVNILPHKKYRRI